MRNLKTLMVLLGMLLMSASPAGAQSFLKKAKEKMEKAKEQVEKVNKSVQKGKEQVSNSSSNSSNSSYNNSSSSESAGIDEVQEDKDLHPELTFGRVLRDTRKSLKTTPSTITLESASEHYDLSDFHDGMALVALSGQSPYFINKKGEKLNLDFDLSYLEYLASEDLLPRFENGRVLLKKGNDAVIVDKTGKVLKTFNGDIVGLFGFEDGVGLILRKDGVKLIADWIDTNGNKLYPGLSEGSVNEHFIHSAPRSISEGLRAYPTYENYSELWGFIDTNGKWAVDPKYYKVRDFHDGLAAVQANEKSEEARKWGFIDKTGKLVIDFKFTHEPSDFDSGYAVVKNRAGNTVVIDKTGNSVMTVEDQWSLSPFMNGYAILEGYEKDGKGGSHRVSYAVTDGGKKKVAYQTDGHFESLAFDRAAGKVYYHFDRGFGLLDLPNMNSKAEGLRGVFSDGLARVDDGYVNEDGEYVIKITLSEF